MAIYKITNVGANKCLNIYGNNVTSLTNNQNVTLWSDSGNALGTTVDYLLGANVQSSTPILKKEIADLLEECSSRELNGSDKIS